MSQFGPAARHPKVPLVTLCEPSVPTARECQRLSPCERLSFPVGDRAQLCNACLNLDQPLFLPPNGFILWQSAWQRQALFPTLKAIGAAICFQHFDRDCFARRV